MCRRACGRRFGTPASPAAASTRTEDQSTGGGIPSPDSAPGLFPCSHACLDIASFGYFLVLVVLGFIVLYPKIGDVYGLRRFNFAATPEKVRKGGSLPASCF